MPRKIEELLKELSFYCEVDRKMGNFHLPTAHAWMEDLNPEEKELLGEGIMTMVEKLLEDWENIFREIMISLTMGIKDISVKWNEILDEIDNV